MRNLVVFMHISLDGFVAGPDGEMDWIKVDDQLFEYGHQRIQGCDTALYGRKTFEMMEGYWPTAADQPGASTHDLEHSAWYKTVNKFVVSRTLKQAGEKVIIGDNPGELVDQIKASPGSEVLLFGSPSVARELIKNNQVDEFWLFLNPVILGEGIQFLATGTRIPLKLMKRTRSTAGWSAFNTVESSQAKNLQHEY